MNKPKEIREWINLILTIVGPLVLGWLI